MIKDYAKRRRPKPRVAYNNYNGPFMPAWGWMFIGLFIGLLLSGILYVKFLKKPPQQVAMVTQSPEIKPQPKTKAKTKAKKLQEKNRFDFYTVLPSMAKDEPLIETAKEKPQAYLIRAGNFQKLIEAEELKAQLAMAGFEASIQTIKKSDATSIYRITLGPFENKDKAFIKQQELEQSQRLHSVLIKNNV